MDHGVGSADHLSRQITWELRQQWIIIKMTGSWKWSEEPTPWSSGFNLLCVAFQLVKELCRGFGSFPGSLLGRLAHQLREHLVGRLIHAGQFVSVDAHVCIVVMNYLLPFRTLCVQSYKKYFKKNAFGEDINTISVQNTIQFVKRNVILRMGIVPNNH